MKRRIPRRFIVATVIAASTLGVAAQPAVADKPDDRGCPNDKFELRAVVDDFDREVDKNGDLQVCSKPIPAAPHGVDNFNVIDNVSNSGGD